MVSLCPLQIQDVYITTYETCGQYWPYIHHYILVAIVIMQITMVGLFGLKSKPAASFSTIPLLVLTLLFNEYCKARFLPTFYQFSVKVQIISASIFYSCNCSKIYKKCIKEKHCLFAGCKGQGWLRRKNRFDGTEPTKCHRGIQPSLFAATRSWRRGVEFVAAVDKFQVKHSIYTFS